MNDRQSNVTGDAGDAVMRPDDRAAPDARVAEAHPDPGGLAEMVKIAAPTVATMTSFTVMQFVDKLMVSRIDAGVGGDPALFLTAQGNGGIASFVPISIIMGLVTVINTFVSQSLGAKRPERGSAYAWNGLWLGTLGWLVLLLPAAALMPLVMRGLVGAEVENPERVATLSAQYAQILLVGGVITIATKALSNYFFGMHKPMVVLAAALLGNAVNIGANYVLIFGHFGVPAMGVTGAALGTLIGTAFELIIPFAIFLSPSWNRRYATRSQWRPSTKFLRDLFRVGWPGGAMFGNELICFAIFLIVLIGRFGEDHSMVGFITLQYMHLSFMPAVGISVAITATVGKCMGMGRPDLAARRAWMGTALACAYMGVCAVAFVVFRGDLIEVFVPDETPPEKVALWVELGGPIMIAAAAFQVFDALAVSLSGGLRGAGDTVWPGVATIVLSWTCIVGLGWGMAVVFPEMGSLGPWIGCAVYISVLGLALLWRFLQGKWKSIRLVDHEEPDLTAAGYTSDGLV